MRVEATCNRWHSNVDSQLIRYARDFAQSQLCPDSPRTWMRTVQAAEHAGGAVRALERPRGEMIVAAAWLHAIGESPACRTTGLAPVDGAVRLLAEGWPAPVVQLVAHQGQARLLAPAFDATVQLALFERIQGWPSDILDYSVVMSLAEGTDPDPEACLRQAAKEVPTTLRISARDRTERERRLRRAVDRVSAALIAARQPTPQGA